MREKENAEVENVLQVRLVGLTSGTIAVLEGVESPCSSRQKVKLFKYKE